MSAPKNISLKKAAEELNKVLKTSLGDKEACTKAIAQIEETIAAIEQKLIVVSEKIQPEATSGTVNENIDLQKNQNNLDFNTVSAPLSLINTP